MTKKITIGKGEFSFDVLFFCRRLLLFYEKWRKLSFPLHHQKEFDAMERNSFIFYRSFYDALQMFSADVQLALYNAIAGYACYGTEPELEGTAQGVWILIKPQLDANIRRYKNGCKGGAKAHTREALLLLPPCFIMGVRWQTCE